MDIAEVVGVVIALPVVVVGFAVALVDGPTADSTPGHRRNPSMHSAQTVTVCPGSNRSASGVGAVFKNVSRNSPMKAGAWSYPSLQASQLNV